MPHNYNIARVRADNVAVGKNAKILIDDQYNVEQAMAVGPKTKARADSVQFIKFSGDGAIDNQKLAEELASLRAAIREDLHASQDEKMKPLVPCWKQKGRPRPVTLKVRGKLSRA